MKTRYNQNILCFQPNCERGLDSVNLFVCFYGRFLPQVLFRDILDNQSREDEPEGSGYLHHSAVHPRFAEAAVLAGKLQGIGLPVGKHLFAIDAEDGLHRPLPVLSHRRSEEHTSELNTRLSLHDALPIWSCFAISWITNPERMNPKVAVTCTIVPFTRALRKLPFSPANSRASVSLLGSISSL